MENRWAEKTVEQRETVEQNVEQHFIIVRASS